MIFLHETFLWLSLLPIIFATMLSMSSKKTRQAIFSQEIYEKLTQKGKTLSHGFRLTLFTLALVMMFIALAQPVIEKEKIKINQKAIDVIVAMDISRSMEAKDLYPSRLEWAKKKLLHFIDRTQMVRIGVMAFAQSAYVVTPITEDKDVANYLVDNLDTSSITENGTNLLQLLDTSNEQLKDSMHKYILLITDGGDNKDFEEEIAFAKENHLTLFILGVGTQKGAPIEDKYGKFLKKEGKIILTQLNTKIKDLALQTGGVYIQSIASDEDISTMLKEIKKIAEAKTIASKEIRSFVEFFSYFLIAALLLLFFAFHSLPRKGLSALVLLFALAHPNESQAGLTDFQVIKEASTAYEKSDFNVSKKAFESLAKESPSPETTYNLANTLYKQKKYKEAIEKYKSIPKSSDFKHKALHNLGNAYAYSKKLPEAIKAYEDALKIEEDKETKENLEAVKKMQEKQKKKKQNKNKKDNNKQNRDGKDKKDKKKEKQENKDKDKDKDKKEQKSSKKEQERKQKEKEKAKQEKQKQENNRDKKSEKDKKEAAKQQKLEAKPSQKDLTDKEEKKLLQQLQMQKGQTFRYKIPSKFQKENHNDQPW